MKLQLEEEQARCLEKNGYFLIVGGVAIVRGKEVMAGTCCSVGDKVVPFCPHHENLPETIIKGKHDVGNDKYAFVFLAAVKKPRRSVAKSKK